MKTTLLVLALLCISVTMHAQVVRVSTDIIVGKHIANSAGDSVVNIDVPYNGTAISGITGLFPDSIRLVFSATDTISGVLWFKGAYGTGTTYSRDSIGVVLTTGSVSTSGYTISVDTWKYKSLLGVVYLAKSSGNGVLAARKVWVRVERFFTSR